MARRTWAVEKWNGAIWASDGTLYAPNDSLSVDLVSTLAKASLADGSNAYLLPTTKYNKEPLRLIWLEILQSDSFRTKIENYIINGNYLRITTGLSEQFTGRFTAVRRVWILGVENTYDLECTFERQI